MNANELRIGNCVYFTGNGNNNPIQVKELWDRELVADYLGNKLCLFYTEDDLQPIPLTPEILSKCGFEKRLLDNGKVNGEEYTIKVGADGFKLFFGWYVSAKSWTDFKIIGNGCYDEAGEMVITETCKFLHQLQNLYFSLTGQELNYTP